MKGEEESAAARMRREKVKKNAPWQCRVRFSFAPTVKSVSALPCYGASGAE
ncbi:hypothetical protein [Enterobacter hormaechei]|nr:hypothetical protein [Enterobacter hormaechei]